MNNTEIYVMIYCCILRCESLGYILSFGSGYTIECLQFSVVSKSITYIQWDEMYKKHNGSPSLLGIIVEFYYLLL